MRLDEHRFESEAGGLDAGDDVEQIEVGMGAPGVGVGAGRLWLFGPGGKAEGDHVAPGLELLDIVVAHAGVLHGSGEIEAVVVGRGRNG